MPLTQYRRICSATLVLELRGFQPRLARLCAGSGRLSFVGHMPSRLDFFAEYGVVSAADENTLVLFVGDESLRTKLHDSFSKCWRGGMILGPLRLYPIFFVVLDVECNPLSLAYS